MPSNDVGNSETIAAVSPSPPTAARRRRDGLRIAPELLSRLVLPSYDGAVVAAALHACGFDVIPLGGVKSATHTFATEEDLRAHLESVILPLGGVHTGTETRDDGHHATFMMPLGDDGKDRTKVPAIKDWQTLPFDLAWWKRGEVVALPPGRTEWGRRNDAQPILERRGDSRRNVGIRTGGGLLVLDLDRKGGVDGVEELERIFGDRVAQSLPDTFTVVTPSGGEHRYYVYPPEMAIGCSASVVAPGVDIRADGGLVVGAGSVSLNGRRYAVSECVPIAELPTDAIGLLLERQSRRGSGGRASNVVPLRPTVTREAALDRVLAKHVEVMPGTRHATLVSVAGALRNLLADDVDLEWALREFAARRQLALRDKDDLDNIIDDAKTKFARSALTTGKTTIIVTHDQAQVIRELERAIDRVDWLYHRGGSLVRVVNSGATRQPTILQVPVQSLAPHTTDYVEWIKLKEGDDGNVTPVPVSPPFWAVAGLASSPHTWSGIRQLDGIVSYPVLRPDGSVFAQVGYDAALRLLLVGGAEGIAVPESPSRADAAGAAKAILDLVADFPFASDVDSSVFLAALLTPLCRYAGVTNVPLFLVDKNTRGAGGSLLADTIGTILKGQRLPRVPQSPSDEEQRKVITSVLLAGDDLVLFDNLSHPLGGASIDALLTGPVWRDRRLATNEMTMVPNLATFYATGNNVEIKGDTTRRVLRMRLESPHEKPEERVDFRHPDLLGHALRERPRLLSAALTILRAFCAAGRPQQGLAAWGSFESWSALVANAIAWVGLPDPSRARMSMDLSSDADRGDLADLLEAWSEIDTSGDGVTARKITSALNDDPEGRLLPRLRAHFVDRRGRVLRVREVSAKLTKLRSRVVGGLHLVSEYDRTKTSVWRVENVSGPRPATPPTEVSEPSTHIVEASSEGASTPLVDPLEDGVASAVPTGASPKTTVTDGHDSGDPRVVDFSAVLD